MQETELNKEDSYLDEQGTANTKLTEGDSEEDQ